MDKQDLLLILLVIAAFPALFVLAERRNAISDAIAAGFDCLAKPLSTLCRGLVQAIAAVSDSLDKALQGLRYAGPHNDHNLSTWVGWDLIGPLIYLLLAVLLAAGDFYISILRFAALMRLPSSAPPAQLDLLTGVLWVGMILLWGFILFDIYGVTPIGRPWHNYSTRARAFLKVLVITALFLSLIAGMGFWLWGQLMISGRDIPLLGWGFIALFALLLNAAVAFSGWSAFPGVASLYALGLMAIRMILRLVFLVLSIVIRTLDAFAAVLTALLDVPAGLGRTIWNWICTFRFADRLNLKPIPPFRERRRIGADTSSRLIPARPTEEPIYRPEERKEIPMKAANNHRTTNIVGFDESARQFLPTMRRAADTHGSTRKIASMGLLSPNGRSNDRRPHFDRDGVKDASPSESEMQEALAHSSLNGSSNRLTHTMIDKVLEPSLAGNSHGQTLLVHSLFEEELLTEEFARVLKRRQPGQTLVGTAFLPQPDQWDYRLQKGYNTASKLSNDGIVPTTFLFDPRSPYARRNSEEAQDESVSDTMASLIGADTEYDKNPSFAEVAQRLGEHSPFAGLSEASLPVSAGKRIWFYSPFRRVFKKLPDKGHGVLSDTITQAKEATKQALTDPAALTIDQPIDLNKPLFVVYTVPIDPNDTRFLEFVTQMRQWLATHAQFAKAVPIFASGNGTPNPKLSGDYFVLVSALYPLPNPPAPLATIFNGDKSEETEGVR